MLPLTPTINIANNTTGRYPYEGSDEYDHSHDVVPEEAQHIVYVNILYDVPETFDHVLYCLLTYSLITKALYTRSSIGQNIVMGDWKTCFVQTLSAATFTGIGDYIAHAAVHALRLAVRHARAVAAPAPLRTLVLVRDGGRLGAVGGGSVADGLPLAGGVRGLPAHEPGRREHTTSAARGVLIAADSALIFSQFTILIAAHIIVFSTKQASVTFLSSFDTKISTKTLLRFRETSSRFGLQHFSDRSQAAR